MYSFIYLTVVEPISVAQELIFYWVVLGLYQNSFVYVLMNLTLGFLFCTTELFMMTLQWFE